MSKENLRKKLIKLRKTNFKGQGMTFVQFKKILNKLNLKNNINIGGYYPINSEISCLDILKILEKNNFKISLPITKKNNNMDFYKWSFKDSLSVSQQGIPEPNTKKKVIPDVLIVPLVGFDRYKFRLGYGGGFYDRTIGYLSERKLVFTLGCAYSEQISQEDLPRGKHDKPLDAVATENGVIFFDR